MPSWSSKPYGAMTAAVFGLTYPARALPTHASTSITPHSNPPYEPKDKSLFADEPPTLTELICAATMAKHLRRQILASAQSPSGPPGALSPLDPATTSPAGSTAAPTYKRPPTTHVAASPSLQPPFPELYSGASSYAYGQLKAHSSEPLSQNPTSPSSFIHGGTSSIGLWAILRAKEHAYTVSTTTPSGSKASKVKEASAGHILLKSSLITSLQDLYPADVDCLLEFVGLLILDLLLIACHGTAVITSVLSNKMERGGIHTHAEAGLLYDGIENGAVGEVTVVVP